MWFVIHQHDAFENVAHMTTLQCSFVHPTTSPHKSVKKYKKLDINLIKTSYFELRLKQPINANFSRKNSATVAPFALIQCCPYCCCPC
jgi:hypothetical protein